MDNVNIKLGDKIGSLKRAYSRKKWESVYNELKENNFGLESVSLNTLLKAQSTEMFFYIAVNEYGIRVLVTQYLHVESESNGILNCSCHLDYGIFLNKPSLNANEKFFANYNKDNFPLKVTEDMVFYKINSATFHYIAERKFDL